MRRARRAEATAARHSLADRHRPRLALDDPRVDGQSGRPARPRAGPGSGRRTQRRACASRTGHVEQLSCLELSGVVDAVGIHQFRDAQAVGSSDAVQSLPLSTKCVAEPSGREWRWPPPDMARVVAQPESSARCESSSTRSQGCSTAGLRPGENDVMELFKCGPVGPGLNFLARDRGQGLGAGSPR